MKAPFQAQNLANVSHGQRSVAIACTAQNSSRRQGIPVHNAAETITALETTINPKTINGLE